MKIKFLKKKDYHLILNHYANANLPNRLKKYFSQKHLNKILDFMSKDKKNNSAKINIIILKEIGKPIIKNYYE